MLRTFKFRLYPTKLQAVELERYLVFSCRLYNAALEQRRDAYRKQNVSVSYNDQQKELGEFRRSDPEFASIATTILRSSLKCLDLAYRAFFRRVKSGAKRSGFPRFRSSRRYDSFSFFATPVIDIKRKRIKVPKLGFVKLKLSREIVGVPKDAVVRRDATGKWWVSIMCNMGPAPRKVVPVSHVGIDLGLMHFATLSTTGEHLRNPRLFKHAQGELAEKQRIHSLREKGSKSKERARVQVAKAHQRVKNLRKEHAITLVKRLVKDHDVISYEELNVKGMAKGIFAKSVADAAWSTFIHWLVCKAEEAGKWAVSVDPRGTSQRCSSCHKTVHKELSDRRHVCECGCDLDRDHNAALNVDGLGWSLVKQTLEMREQKPKFRDEQGQQTRRKNGVQPNMHVTNVNDVDMTPPGNTDKR